MWGRRAPSHSICCVYLMRDQRTLVTGSTEGQILLWQMDNAESWQLTPRNMLIAHTAPVR